MVVAATALAWLDGERIIAGCGNNVEVYGRFGKRLIVSNGVLRPGTIIRGIIPSPEDRSCLVFGGRELVLYSTKTHQNLESLVLPDRIIYLGIDGDEYVIVLAYGQVATINRDHLFTSNLWIWEWTRLDKDFLVLSACVWRSADAKLMLAYGSVFDGIHIFEYTTDSNVKCLRPVSHLEGHAGSIFDVAISKSGLFLASCSDDRKVILWSMENMKSLKSFEGHSSRVWRVKWFQENAIISGGEDGTVRINTIGPNMVYDRVMETGIGLNTWSLAVEESKGLLATASDDCGIKVWNLFVDSAILSPREVSFLANMAEPKSFDFGSKGIVTLLVDGSIVAEDGPIIPTDIPQSAMSKMGLMKIHGSDLIFGSLDGKLYIDRNFGGLEDTIASDCIRVDLGFTSRISYLDVYMDKDGHSLGILVQSGNGHCAVVKIIHSDKVEIFSLQEKPGTIMCTHKVPHTDALLIGTRDGRIAVINVREATVSTLLKHSADAVTSIVAIKNDPSELLITDRTGYLTLLKYTDSSLSRIWQHRLTKSWLEQVIIVPESQEILVAGFESTEFFMLSFTRRAELFRCATGGAHRFWRLRLRNRNESSLIDFGFIRLGKVFKVLIDSAVATNTGTILREPFHGSEIRAIVNINDSFCPLVTGGEDGRLLLYHNEQDSNSLRVLDQNCSHKSGIKCLAWSTKHQLLLSGGSAEELLVWRILDGAKLSLLQRVVFATTDARIMAIATHESMVVVTASDSTIRVFEISSNSQLVELCRGPIHPKHCPLRLCHFKNNLFISGSTGGELVLLHVRSQEQSILDELRVSSGVNSIAVANDIIAVGEDGGNITLVKCTDKKFIEILSTPSCHHSCITGLSFEQSGDEDSLLLVSVSVDQRVKRWTIDTKVNTMQLTSTQVTSVPDIAGVLLTPSIIVVGSGFEVLPTK